MIPSEALQRIQKRYEVCDDEERAVLVKILKEFAETGYSQTYTEVWAADFKEIPVDKETFLTSSEFLGNSNNNGASIYPVWMDVMKELERTGNQYYEIVLTGATRTGKTSTAVSDCAYQLYWLMCLRDPQSYFGLKSVTNISIFFFNLTETLAKGVAYKEFISTISVSPWFQKHGHFTGSELNPGYVPEGGLIEIVYGSAASHALGKATFCLVGETTILTTSGPQMLKDLAGEFCTVLQYNIQDDNVVPSEAYVAVTQYTDHTIKVELEDGSIIEGTEDHLVLLADGTYKRLGDLTLSDNIKNL